MDSMQINDNEGILDDHLVPIILRGSTCIESDLLFSVEDKYREPWKIVFLVFIVLKIILRLVGLLDERRLLTMPKGKLEIRYNELPKDVTDLISMQ